MNLRLNKFEWKVEVEVSSISVTIKKPEDGLLGLGLRGLMDKE